MEEWKDSYTGKTHKSAGGVAAEMLAKSQQNAGSERRTLFLQGTEKPRRPDSEEQEAELIFPQRTGGQEKQGARKFFGQSHFAHEGNNQAQLLTPFPQAPMRNVPVKAESANQGGMLKSTGEGLKQPAQLGMAKIKARDAAPLPSESRDSREATHSVQANQHNETVSKPGLVQHRSVKTYTPIEVQSKVDMSGSSQVAKDIVLDILMDTRGKQANKEAVQGLQDIALKMVMPVSQHSVKSLDLEIEGQASGFTSRSDPSMPNTKSSSKSLHSVGARGENNFSEKEEHLVTVQGKKAMEIFQKAGTLAQQNKKQEALVADLTQHFLSADVQKAALTALTTNWKEDPQEQLRMGTWAVHVLSSRVDSVPAELLRGMKEDALMALGRLSMQLLAASTKSAKAEAQPMLRTETLGERSAPKFTGNAGAHESHEGFSVGQDSLEIMRTVENLSAVNKSAIKGSNEFFRLESIQGDLQALQNNISLDVTADVLVEGFIEALRQDNLESNVELRSDILASTFNASQSNARAGKKNAMQSQRSQQVTFDVESKVNKTDKRQKFQVVHEEELAVHLDLGIKEKGEKESKPEVVFEQTVGDNSEQGAWANTPSSKYV